MLAFDPPNAFVQSGSDRFALDSKGSKAFVSHAHFDHYRSLRNAELVLSSRETMDLLLARGKAVPEKTQSFHQGVSARFTLLNAGHVLGSRMLFVQGSESFLYTGDFLSEDSLTQKAAKPVECDTLLLECTYGSPEYVFPDRSEVYADMGRWANEKLAMGRIAVFGAYALGKAQEVVSALNEAGICPVVDQSIAAVNEVYQRHGVALDYTCNDPSALKGGFAAVLPMHNVKPFLAEGLYRAYGRKVSLSVATGWSLTNGFGVDQAFCLSDHNDFPGLVEFVSACNPKKVFCTHGPSAKFASELRKRGFDAQPLESLGEKQKTLAGFSRA
ncbi:hypothetical protein HY572_05690 [Candidatus Micrarchaeota archaeon]|nr:hypothetical protein [Candidatus Micrarchaeota archaeon]